MSALPLIKSISKSRSLVIVIMALFFLIVAGVFGYALWGSWQYQKTFDQRQSERMAAPTVAVKRQVRRVRLKRINEKGEEEIIELNPDGTVSIYDKDGNLLKSGLKGFGRIDDIFDLLNDNLDAAKNSLFSSGKKYEITVETNKGTETFIIGDGDGSGENDDLIEEIIEDIEDIGDEVINPTPIPTPGYSPPPTPTPQPSASPTPPPPGGPTPTPTPVPSGEPTPLPEYMTKPPFDCSDYQTNKPTIISNIICGLSN